MENYRRRYKILTIASILCDLHLMALKKDKINTKEWAERIMDALDMDDLKLDAMGVGKLEEIQ